LIAAAERGETLVVRRLLAATRRNCVDVARLLINEGADVDAKDVMQDSPFLLAG
jgi:uncharacterized protein